MFGSNGHYGHRLILNAYANVPAGRPIPGLVQHGWNYDLGATLDDIRLPAPEPFFIWSERNLRQCRRAGIAELVTPLGAPFTYMPPVETPIRPAERSLLVVPIHGWEREKIPHDFRAYAQQIGELRKEFGAVTVCLYWFDFQFEEYRRPFEDAGLRVVTVGPRDENPRFLFDLRKLVLEHEYVCSNRAQTAAFYALALDRKFFLYGPAIGLDGRFDHSGQLFDAWQRAEYPQLAWEGFKDVCYRDLGERELGLEFRREPDALRELFLWLPSQSSRLEGIIEARAERVRRKRWDAKVDRMKQRFGRWLPGLRPQKEGTQ